MSDDGVPGFQRLLVCDAGEVAKDIFRFDLRRADGDCTGLPRFTCGAHIVLQTPSGRKRSYSLCNDPDDLDRYVIAVRRDPQGRGGSLSMASVRPGDTLWVSTPHNHFPLIESSAGYVFIAGGIGITPIMSMLQHLRRQSVHSFKLHYLTRSPEATPFAAELAEADLAGRVTVHHNYGDPARRKDLWPELEQPRGHIYCCGPASLMDEVRDMTGHWPSSAVHFEAFNNTDARKADDKGFRVRLRCSGETIDVPADGTILEAMRACGYTVPSSCETGSCGTCRTRLLAGEADHRDFVLAPHERDDNIIICVSRAISELIEIDR